MSRLRNRRSAKRTLADDSFLVTHDIASYAWCVSTISHAASRSLCLRATPWPWVALKIFVKCIRRHSYQDPCLSASQQAAGLVVMLRCHSRFTQDHSIPLSNPISSPIPSHAPYSRPAPYARPRSGTAKHRAIQADVHMIIQIKMSRMMLS